MKEVKSITVAPDDHDEAIRIYQSFGYNLLSLSEVKDTNTVTSHEVWGDTLYEKTNTTVDHYMRLTFDRDQNMPNYQQIKEHEMKYESLSNQRAKLVYPKGFGIILTFIGLCLYMIPGILMIIYNCTIRKKRRIAYNDEFSSLTSQMEKELTSARALLV